MSGKKYKPALFELMNKGNLKPRSDGSLPAPDWLNGSKKKNFSLNFLHRKSKTVPHPQKPTLTSTGASTTTIAAPKAPTTPITASAVKIAASTASVSNAPIATAPAAPASQKWRFDASKTAAAKSALSGSFDRRIDLSISYGILAVAMLVLVLMLLAMFWLGQISAQNHAGNPVTPIAKTLSGNEKLEELRNSPAQPDALIPARSRSAPESAITAVPSTETATEPSPVGAASPAAVGVNDASAVATADRTGQSLIICTHDNQRELRQLQSYFNRNGLQAEIGRFGNKYVLHSRQTFDTVQQPGCAVLKKTVSELGARYNQEREPGSAIFSPRTFAESSTYFVDVSRIE